MIELLAETLNIAQVVLWAGFLVLLRLGAMISLLPGIGERSLPMRVRLGLALALSALLAPLIDAPTLSSGDFPELLFLCAKEIGVGLLMGLSIRFLAHGLLVAGSVAAQATSLAQLFGNAMSDGPQPSIALVLYWGGLALFKFPTTCNPLAPRSNKPKDV